MRDPLEPAAVSLGADERGAATEVLATAFADYPVVRFVLGADWEFDRVRRLVGFFVAARFLRNEPAFGVRDEEALGAVALTSRPDAVASSPDLLDLRDAVWSDLGSAARDRYHACGEVWSRLVPPERRLHLNMLGVLPHRRGRGYGRLLLDRVHALARATPGCRGVSLTTEDPANVEIYRHVGYEVVGEAWIGPDLPTWSMFRRNDDGG